MKKRVYEVKIESEHGVRSWLRCSDRKILEEALKEYLDDPIYSFKQLTPIEKGHHYCTDGNTELDVTVLNP